MAIGRHKSVKWSRFGRNHLATSPMVTQEFGNRAAVRGFYANNLYVRLDDAATRAQVGDGLLRLALMWSTHPPSDYV
jgi:hypothetical protein